jgi:DNA-binding transcriptional ArsR family regulator
LFDAFASVAHGLGMGGAPDCRRAGPGERSVDEVATEIGQSLANTSHHLRLGEGGLVRSRRDGVRVVYRPQRPGRLWTAVRDVAITLLR